MNFLPFNFLAMPRGFSAALLALNFLVCSDEAMATGVPDACRPVATAPTVSPVRDVREGHGAICGVLQSAPHGVTSNRHVFRPRALGVGRAGNAPTTFPRACSSAGRTVAPTAQLADVSTKELSAVSIRRRISAAHPSMNPAAADHPAAATTLPEACRV